MSKVTVIPATVNPFTGMPVTGLHKRRVAGYARVSTDKDEQFTSYEAQVDYYTKYIKANPEWEFVTVYTDEGISGTSTKRRDGFNTMIDAALNGRIDLIVTKSVSRFARNTRDLLELAADLQLHDHRQQEGRHPCQAGHGGRAVGLHGPQHDRLEQQRHEGRPRV